MLCQETKIWNLVDFKECLRKKVENKGGELSWITTNKWNLT